jgi:hypothetical protein
MSELKTNLCDGCTLWPCGAHAPIGVDGHIVTECANRKPTSGAAISTLKAQRDELLAAAKTAYEVLIQERDHIPMTLRLVMPNGAIKRLRAAIANAERPAGC